MNMDRGRWDTTGYRPEWDISPSLSHSAKFYQTSLRHWLNLGLASKSKERPSTPSFALTKTIIEKVQVKPPEEKKLPVIETKQSWMPEKPDKSWSFSSRTFNFPTTAFGSASKAKRLPSMQFKRIIPSHVYKSRHATNEQIALQARLRRTFSRQKIKKFRRKVNRVFEEKAALAIECAYRQSRARNLLMKVHHCNLH